MRPPLAHFCILQASCHHTPHLVDQTALTEIKRSVIRLRETTSVNVNDDALEFLKATYRG